MTDGFFFIFCIWGRLERDTRGPSITDKHTGSIYVCNKRQQIIHVRARSLRCSFGNARRGVLAGESGGGGGLQGRVVFWFNHVLFVSICVALFVYLAGGDRVVDVADEMCWYFVSGSCKKRARALSLSRARF